MHICHATAPPTKQAGSRPTNSADQSNQATKRPSNQATNQPIPPSEWYHPSEPLRLPVASSRPGCEASHVIQFNLVFVVALRRWQWVCKVDTYTHCHTYSRPFHWLQFRLIQIELRKSSADGLELQHMAESPL